MPYAFAKPVGARMQLGHRATNGLVAAWLFDEQGGGVLDYGGRGLNQSVSGTATRSPASLVFDGSSTYTTAGNALSLGPIKSFAVLFKPTVTVDASSAIGVLLQLNYGTSASFYLALGSATGLLTNEYITLVDTNNNTRAGLTTSAGSISAEPHLLLCLYNNSAQWEFYLDGAYTGSLATAGGWPALITTNANAIYFGCTDGDGGGPRAFFDGQIYGAWLWNRAFASEFEIAAFAQDPYGMFRRRRIFKAGAVALQLLQPDADDSISDWTDQAGGTTNLYAKLDETPFDDGDYIKSPAPSGTTARFRLSDPAAGKTLIDPVKIRYRFKKTNVDDQKLTVSLKQGTTLIAAWIHTGAGLTETFQTAEQTLSSGELAAITDFNNLYIEFQASPP